MAINFNNFKTRVVRYPLLLVAAMAAVVITGFEQGLTKSDWSSWVQAIGSIGAILASGYIATWQQRKSTADRVEQRRQDHLVQAVAIFTLMRELEFEGNRGIATIENIIAGDESTIWEHYNFLVGVEASFQAIPLWMLPNPGMVRDIAAMLRFIPRTRERITALSNSIHGPDHDASDTLFRLNSLRMEFRIWVEQFEKHVVILGGDPNTGTHMGW